MDKMRSADVAVIIPNLNYGRYLEHAVESAHGQTVQPRQIIVVDGGSVDNSKNIARQMGVTWIETPAHGQGDARNVGIRATTCKFIVPLDADDWIDDTFIERCLERMPAWQPTLPAHKIGVVATGLMRASGNIQWPLPPFTLEALLTGNRLFCCSMFRRQCWEEVGGYDTEPGYEDWDFWCRIVKAGWQVAHVNEALFHYNDHPNSSTSNMTRGLHEKYVQQIKDRYAIV